MSEYTHTPNTICFKDIEKNDFNLSASQYNKVIIPNDNCKLVRDFLTRNLVRGDLGVEVGAMNYIEESPYKFIRTKALQSHSFLLDITQETALPVLPNEFIQMHLRKGDLLISKDSNIGEIVILDKDYPNFMLSSAIYKLPVKEEWKYYLLSFVKHSIFREQLDSMVPKGATIRHAKTMFLDCKIPLPKYNTEAIVVFVSILTQAIINKEIQIKVRFNKILELIEEELKLNQKPNNFVYKLPKFKDLSDIGRLDTNMYRYSFKKEIFYIINYEGGFKTIEQLGFKMSRGQNLQVSNIGKSIYSPKWYPNFYTLILPMFLSKYGTVDKVSYLGNRNTLKTLKKGDLIFGAEGFEKGRSVVIVEEQLNSITNIHGITFQQDKHDLNNAIFVKCILDYLRSKGLIDLFAVGGNGGSLAQKYWTYIPFPLFSDKKRTEIVSLYFNSTEYDTQKFTVENFIEKDIEFNKKAGIYELDKSLKQLKLILNETIDDIVNNNEVNINFNI